MPNRRTAVLAILVAMGISFILHNIDRISPREWTERPVADRHTVSIMSFNIVRGGRPTASALDTIKAVTPDILCMQEFTEKLAGEFTRRLGALYPYRFLEPRPEVHGIAIASRLPMTDGAVLGLKLPGLPAATAVVSIGKSKVRIACVHFMPPHIGFFDGGDLRKKYEKNKAIRLRQARSLVEVLDARGEPAIITGDMNEWPGQAALTVLGQAGFRDSCRSGTNRCGPSWPGPVIRLPAMFRVDYVLGRGVLFTDAAVLEAGGSDHYPVVARFSILR